MLNNFVSSAVLRAIKINNKLTSNDKVIASRLLVLFWVGCGWAPLAGGFALTSLLVLATSPVTIYANLLTAYAAQMFAVGFLSLTTLLIAVGRIKGPKAPPFLLER